MSHPSDQQYRAKWKKVVNVLKSSNLGLSRVAQAGSRAIQKQRYDSDMDVIFSITGNPSKEQFYPKLIRVLEANFRDDKVYPGDEHNIVHLDFQSGEKFELVLKTERKFDQEHKDDKDYRRENL
ncbi:MAG: hypothetical protein ACFFGZ_10285 [Candidatus Thorarchaeota archaeon]